MAAVSVRDIRLDLFRGLALWFIFLDHMGPETVDQWFDKTAFQAVPSGTFGNAGRNILRGPSWKGLDLSLQIGLAHLEGETNPALGRFVELVRGMAAGE